MPGILFPSGLSTPYPQVHHAPLLLHMRAFSLFHSPHRASETANLYAGKTAALLRLLVHSVLAVELAVFLLLKTARSIFLFLRARIIPALAFRAFQYNNLTHDTSQYPCFDETAPPFS